MKLQTKLTLFFLTFSIFILIPITIFFIYQNNNVTVIQEKHNLEQVSKRVAHFMNNFLNSKVDSTLIMSSAPIVREYLIKSNKEFHEINKDSTNNKIDKLNNKWKSYEDDKSKFIQSFLTNKLSEYFKSQQKIFKNTYGEIFLTNKYGALVSSTGKLTTYAHYDKYWWKGAYNDGQGKIYLDDRGFDKSVNGYVIGVVVPVIYQNETIGILKANLNIKGSISNIVENFENHNTGQIEIVRSKGLIVYKKGIEPLSQSLEPNLIKELHKEENSSTIFKNDIVAFSKINIKHNIYDIEFAGKPKTIDNIKGNQNESWYIIIREKLTKAHEYLEEIKEMIFLVIIIFLLLSFILGRFVAYYISSPIKLLLSSTNELSKGNLKSIQNNSSNDEIGQLTKSFNNMSEVITNNIQAKDELLQKIETLKNEYESTINESNLVSKTDIDGNITYVNNAFCETLGYSKEELLGKNHRIHKNPNLPSEHYKELWDTILLGKVWTGVITNISKNGEIFYLHTSVFPIFDDNKNIVEFIAMRFNITNEIQLKEEIKAQNEELSKITKRLNLAQKIAKIGSYEFNLDSNNVIWSDEHYRILNEEVQSFKPTFETYLSYIHPDDFDEVKAYLNNTIYLKELIKFEYRVILKNGEIKYVESTSNVVEYNSDGNPLVISGTILDITNRVNKENEIKEKNKILFYQSKMSTMGEMLGNIAHQWRQPLSVISTLATGTKLKKELEYLEDEEFYSSMDSINTSVQYLSKTIDDFRNFFNPNKLEDTFYIKTVFDKTFTLINTQFKVRNIKFILNIEEIKHFGLENELLQVLINLLNNARDAFEDKKMENKLIFVNAYNQENHSIIEIKDNAGGIDNTILNKIFEPYFTTKHQSQGTGIGLYMSKEIIEKHMNGIIKVENSTFIYEKKHYKGAIFTIKLKK